MVQKLKKYKMNLQEKAKSVEIGMLSGQSALREIQQGRAGLRPVKTRLIKMTNGEVCIGQEEALNCWQEHLNTILNVKSCFSDHVLDDVRQYPIQEELDHLEKKCLIQSERARQVVEVEMECYQRC